MRIYSVSAPVLPAGPVTPRPVLLVGPAAAQGLIHMQTDTVASSWPAPADL